MVSRNSRCTQTYCICTLVDDWYILSLCTENSRATRSACCKLAWLRVSASVRCLWHLLIAFVDRKVALYLEWIILEIIVEHVRREMSQIDVKWRLFRDTDLPRFRFSALFQGGDAVGPTGTWGCRCLSDNLELQTTSTPRLPAFKSKGSFGKLLQQNTFWFRLTPNSIPSLELWPTRTSTFYWLITLSCPY